MRTTSEPSRRAFVIWIAASIAVASPVRAGDAPTDLPLVIAKGCAAVQALHYIKPGTEVTLDTFTGPLTGSNDDFLRRRTGAQVIASGLSSGCGDNALAFVEAVRSEPIDVLLVEGAEVSSESLLTTFSGHMVVAVRSRDGPNEPWILVDTTRRRLISEPSSPEAKSFATGGRCYWIGYCGPLAGYPAHSEAELKRAYAAALAQVPPAVLAQHTVRLHFALAGTLGNPRIANLKAYEAQLSARLTDPSERNVTIHLTDGGPDSATSLTYSDASGWTAAVGLQSGCHSSLLGYFERTVIRDESSGEALRP